MLTAEADHLKRVCEQELKSIMNTCLNDIPYKQSGYQPNVILPTLSMVLDRLHARSTETMSQFNQEIVTLLGAYTNDTAKQIIKQSSIHLHHYLQELIEKVKTSYHAIFLRWLVAARHQAEQDIENKMLALLNTIDNSSNSNYYSSEAQLHQDCQIIYQQALATIGYDYFNNATNNSTTNNSNTNSTSTSTTNPSKTQQQQPAEYQDTIQLLKRQYDDCYHRVLDHYHHRTSTNRTNTHSHNSSSGHQYLLLDQHLQSSVQELHSLIAQTARELRNQHPRGYPRELLQEKLNNFYYDKLNLLLTQVQAPDQGNQSQGAHLFFLLYVI
jgi:hypothetical protein